MSIGTLKNFLVKIHNSLSTDRKKATKVTQVFIFTMIGIAIVYDVYVYSYVTPAASLTTVLRDLLRNNLWLCALLGGWSYHILFRK